MALSQGDHLGPYEVLGLLGAGGMGEVYRARDPRLDREVAIKVLPEDLADDPERLRRFEKEAKAAGALNHPNILAVYDVGTHGGRPYLVTELLEGDTLRERMVGTGLPAEKGVDYAVQIARGLAAAHDKGIVHRDLKPENLFVTRDGLVKILDFGLAKLRGPQGQPQGSGDDVGTASRTTDPGTVIGTAGYMSPEQVRGQAIDHRCDIFSFGAVLYEMLSGQRAFRGDSGVEILNAILKEHPPEIASVERGFPPHLAHIARRCLEKDTNRRFQSAHDLAFDLEEMLSEPVISGTTAVPSPAASSQHRRLMWWVSGAMLVGTLLGGAGIWTLSHPTEPPRPVVRMRLGVQPAEQLGGSKPEERGYIGFQRPTRTDLAFSPDGTRLVFSGGTEGRWQLYVRRLEETEASPIAGTEGAVSPFFSPDGAWLGFWTGDSFADQGELKKVAMSGGLPVSLCETGAVYGASWGPNDAIVFARRHEGLWRVPAEGGKPEPLTALEPGQFSHRLPQVLPGGEAVLFTVQMAEGSWRDARVVSHVLATGERRDLIENAADARYVPTGHLVFGRKGTLLAAPFDPVRLEMTGGSVPIFEGVMQSMNSGGFLMETGAAQVSVSKSGSIAFLEGGVYPDTLGRLVWVDRRGTAEPLPLPAQPYVVPRLSPDGQRVAVGMIRMDASEIWLCDISRRTLTPLTHERNAVYSVWTPDGEGIVFASSGVGGYTNLFRLRTDASDNAERLTTSEHNQYPSSWAPNGRELAFVAALEGGRDIWVLPMDVQGREPRPVAQASFSETHPAFSPDGRWLAFTSDESGREEVWVRPYPGPGTRTQISVNGGFSPSWRADGRELFFRRGMVGASKTLAPMMSVDVTTGPSFTVGQPKVLFEGPYEFTGETRDYDVTPDGQRFLMIETVEQPSQPVTHINVVLNWFEELKRRVPVD